jgi:penicillin-binding protein 1C
LRLEQLAGLYAALARGGEPVPLRFLQEGTPAQTVAAEPLLHAAAAWYVMDILRGAPPPAFAKGGEIAFKTGTSYGFRDAWAAGFDGRYAVAVWLGRPDATSTPGLTGLTKAAPMLFDIFSQIGPDRAPFAPPPHGVIVASSATLPPPLANFREPAIASTASAEAAKPDPPVHIAFPPDRAELEMTREAGGERSPIAFKAEGGVLPLTWLVNGAPIATAPYRRDVFWTPAGEGFVQLSVIDAQGTVDRVTVRLR